MIFFILLFLFGFLYECNSVTTGLQVHTSYTGIDGQISVMFVTEESSSYKYYINYGDSQTSMNKKADATTQTISYNNEPSTGQTYTRYVEESILTGLINNQWVYYQIKCEDLPSMESEVFKMKYYSPTAEEDFEFLVYSDGEAGQGNALENLLSHLESTNAIHDTAFTIYAGDVLFNDDAADASAGGTKPGYELNSDVYADLVEPVNSAHPVLYSPGNHDRRNDFDTFRNRFTKKIGENSGSSDPGYFKSWNFRNIHFVFLAFCTCFSYLTQGTTCTSTESPQMTTSSPQYTWLDNDLKNLDRTKYPIVVVVNHYPLYYDDRATGADVVEDLLESHGGKFIFINGHNHHYSRTCQVYDANCKADYDGNDILTMTDSGNVNLNVGTGGQGLRIGWNAIGWVTYIFDKGISNSHGYLRVKVKYFTDTISGEFIATDSDDYPQTTGTVLDQFSIYMDSWECGGINKNLDSACGEHGYCKSANVCQCHEGWESGSGDCDTQIICSPACENGGVCVSGNICQCNTQLWTGSQCQTPVCSQPCQNGGTCQNPNDCNCINGWTDSDCTGFTCTQTCQNGGICESPDKCNCPDGYIGDDCSILACWDVAADDTDNVCSGHGTCSGPNQCDCITGKENYKGDNCETPFVPDTFCNGIESDAENVCSSNGACMGTDDCRCKEGFVGQWCESDIYCNSIIHSNETVCSGNGKCLVKTAESTTGYCSCNEGYAGENCENIDSSSNLSDEIGKIGIAVAVVVGIIVSVVVLLVIGVFIAIGIFCCLKKQNDKSEFDFEQSGNEMKEIDDISNPKKEIQRNPTQKIQPTSARKKQAPPSIPRKKPNPSKRPPPRIPRKKPEIPNRW